VYLEGHCAFFDIYSITYQKKKKKIGPTKVTSINNKRDMLTTPGYLDPTEKPKRKPQLTVAKSILLKASITIKNKKCDKGSPYIKPRELLKKPDILSFTKMKTKTKHNTYQRNTMCYPRASSLPEKHTPSTNKVRTPN
jgi:hypothetical protein